jgi:hypothetical protein
MATTKYKLAEQAQRILAGGDVTDDFAPTIQELALASGQVMAKLVWLSYQEHKQDGQMGINGQFISAFEDVPVKIDANKKLHYSEVPASPLKLPHDMGIYMVSLMEDQFEPFIPLPNGVLGMLRNQLFSNLEGRQGYFVEADRIYYVGMEKSDGITKVLMKLVITGSQLGIDDKFEVSPEMEWDIIRELVALYNPEARMPEDDINDHRDAMTQ